jgi:protein O-GlcNAc transferase
MGRFVGRSGWVMAAAIAALLSLADGAGAQRPPRPSLPPNSTDQVSIDELFRQGNAAQAAGRFAEAEQIFRAVLRRDSRDAAAYYNLGNALRDQGKLEEAIAQYRQAIALDPKDAYPYNGLGNVLRDQGKLEEAIAQYRQAIALDPKFAYPYNGLGLALYDQGKLEEAIAQYRQAIALDPKLAQVYNNLGNALRDQGKLEEAIALFRQAIALDPKFAAAYYNLGNALRDQGKLEEAIALYRQAIALDPKLAQVYNNLGLALRDQGKLEEAITLYRQAIAIQSNAIRHNNLGYALEQQGNLEAAIAEYEKAVALDPQATFAQNNLRAAREKLAARRNPPALDDLAFVPSPERNPKVALFRATVIVEARFGATGQDAGGLQRGAGWVVKRDSNTLWIVTCRHNVIDKLDRPGTEPTVQFYSQLPEGQTRRKLTTVQLVQQDAALDLAVLEVTGAPTDIKPLVMAEENQIQFTGRVMAIGHPYNQEDSWVAPSGDRTSYNPQHTKFSFSAAIATGHSGGPVFDESDRLIGMVAEISDETSGAPNPNDETQNLSNAISTGQLASAIRIQPIREKLQTWGILP